MTQDGSVVALASGVLFCPRHSTIQQLTRNGLALRNPVMKKSVRERREGGVISKK